MAGQDFKFYQTNKVYGGISNDEYVSGNPGIVYNAVGVELRRNSREWTLSNAHAGEASIDGEGTAIIGGSLTDMICCTSNGYVNGYIIGNQLDALHYRNVNYRNIISYNGYIYLVHTAGIDKLPFVTDYLTSFINVQSIVDPTFGTPGDWTIGSGWTIASNSVTHTNGGGTNVLEPNPPIIVTASQYYRIEITLSSCTNGNCSIKIGNTVVGILGSTTTGRRTYFGTATNTDDFKLTPTNDFDGVLTLCRVFTSPVQFDYYTFPEGNNGIHKPALVDLGQIYISNGNCLYSFNTTTPTGALTKVLGFDPNDDVRCIFRLGDQLIIFANRQDQTRQIFWIPGSTVISRTLIWYDLPIINGVIIGSLIYLWCTKSDTAPRTLWVCDGYNRTLLYKSQILTTMSNDRLYFYGDNTNAIETYQNITFLPGKNQIFSYGNFINELPQAMDREFTLTGNISALFTPGTTNLDKQLWYTTTTGSIYKLGYFDLTSDSTNKQTGGYIEYTPLLLEGDGRGVQIRINYVLPNGSTATNIQIYANINDGGYNLIQTLDSANIDYLGNRKWTFDYNNTFNKIQFKVVLNTYDPAYTPKVSNLIFKYEEINDELQG